MSLRHNLQPLETLERETNRLRRLRVWDQDREDRNLHLIPDVITKCFPAFQWKYDVDEDSPWWKRIYFRFIWLPFARFSYWKVKIIPFERLEPDGSLSWKEQQGVFSRRIDAELEAAKYPFGGYDEVNFDYPERAGTISSRSHFPGSTAHVQYEEHAFHAAKEQEAESVYRLREVLKETQGIVNRFRTANRV